MNKTPSFPKTRWSQVKLAANSSHDRESAYHESLKALNGICSQYWYPIYSYARRSGWDHAEAEDETQIFFQNLAKNNLLEKADPTLGKLRTLLLTVFRRQLASSLEWKNAAKRGGARKHLSLDFASAEERYEAEKPGDENSAEQLYDHAWAVDVTNLALKDLETGFNPDEKETFELLRPYVQILDPDNPQTTAQIAEKIGISDAGVRKKVERLRKSMGEAIRKQISDSLVNPTSEAVTAEVYRLRNVLSPS